MCSIHSAAGEPPCPGWLGNKTLKSRASRAWNSSQRPAPPAPCKNSNGGPAPSSSIWIEVPRTESVRGAGIVGDGISTDEEATVRREPLSGEERAVIGREKQ